MNLFDFFHIHFRWNYMNPCEKFHVNWCMYKIIDMKRSWISACSGEPSFSWNSGEHNGPLCCFIKAFLCKKMFYKHECMKVNSIEKNPVISTLYYSCTLSPLNAKCCILCVVFYFFKVKELFSVAKTAFTASFSINECIVTKWMLY